MTGFGLNFVPARRKVASGASPAPTLSSLTRAGSTPASTAFLSTGGGSMNLTGADFAGAVQVEIDGTLYAATLNSATSVTLASVPAHAIAAGVSVRVRNGDGQFSGALTMRYVIDPASLAWEMNQDARGMTDATFPAQVSWPGLTSTGGSGGRKYARRGDATANPTSSTMASGRKAVAFAGAAGGRLQTTGSVDVSQATVYDAGAAGFSVDALGQFGGGAGFNTPNQYNLPHMTGPEGGYGLSISQQDYGNGDAQTGIVAAVYVGAPTNAYVKTPVAQSNPNVDVKVQVTYDRATKLLSCIVNGGTPQTVTLAADPYFGDVVHIGGARTGIVDWTGKIAELRAGKFLLTSTQLTQLRDYSTYF